MTLRIAQLDEDDGTFHDAAGTWLMGHSERITFGEPYVLGNRLLVDAKLDVSCRHLQQEAQGPATVTCAAHGFRGSLPDRGARVEPPPLQHSGGAFTVMHGRRRISLSLPPAETPARALPVLAGDNPCLGAPCRTADNRRGAACCRDLTLDIVAPEASPTVELLLRSRRSPYLCKVNRTGPDLVECEMISACGYLEDDGISCSLHGRVRPNGDPAKPSICSAWPDLEPGDSGHPGCRLIAATTLPES